MTSTAPQWGLRARNRARVRHATLAAVLIGGVMVAQARGEPRHAIAMHGEPALSAGFAHFPYVNSSAPKGGRLVQGVLGSFDRLNPFIVRGLPPQGLRAPLVSGTNMVATSRQMSAGTFRTTAHPVDVRND